MKFIFNGLRLFFRFPVINLIIVSIIIVYGLLTEMSSNGYGVILSVYIFILGFIALSYNFNKEKKEKVKLIRPKKDPNKTYEHLEDEFINNVDRTERKIIKTMKTENIETELSDNKKEYKIVNTEIIETIEITNFNNELPKLIEMERGN